MQDDSRSRPLTAAQAKDIVDELERALNGYRRWVRRLQATLVVDGVRPAPDDLAEDAHLLSAFGRWYHNEASTYLRNHPAFGTVGENHRHMHDLARRLVAAVNDDADITAAQYNAFVAGVDHFKFSVRELLAEAQEILRYTDPLTGVANRFAMMPSLEQERQRAGRTDHPCCLAMMDLDRFKEINDTYGHHAGDAVLQTVTQYLLDHIRNYDQVYRYGGEEFVVLLPNTPPDRAKRVLDRLRRGLKRQSIRIEGGKALHITASFGVAPLTPATPVKATIRNADKAMYAAKKAGRNRVMVSAGAADRGTAATRKRRAPRGAKRTAPRSG